MIFNNPSWFRSTVLLAGNATEEIFSAAANVRGAWCISAYSYLRVAAGAIPYSDLSWGLTLPPTVNTRNTIIGTTDLTLGEVAGQSKGVFEMNTPYFIPAGNGLWFFNFAAQVGGSARSASYQLL